MINRRKSILNKTRRDSVRSAALKLLQQKEDRENENANSFLRQRRYEDLDNLKIKEDDLNKNSNNTFFSLNFKSRNCAVRRLIPLDQRRLHLKGMMLKKFLKKDITTDIQMLSSLNDETIVKVYENRLKMETFSPNEVQEKSFLTTNMSDRPVEENSFKSLENWKLRMLERRKLKTSLAKRLQTNPESLLISKSAQSSLFSSHQDEIFKIILPCFQNGTGAPITHSIWPVQEETKSKLHVQRYKWKPHIPLQTSMTGYHELILHEMSYYIFTVMAPLTLLDETTKGLESSEKIKIKNEVLNETKYQRFLKDYHYHTPDISELIICSKTYQKEQPQKENTTLSNFEEEEILTELENTKSVRGAILLINDELIFERLNDKDQILSKPNDQYLHIHFPATIMGVNEIKNLYFANRGSCTINFSWKKIEIERHLKTDDFHSAFFFKINKGIVLPDSNVIIPVTFRSKFLGFFDEMWELVTSPVLSSKKIIFHFHAISLRPDYFIFERHLIEENVHQSIIIQISKEIIDDLVRYAVNRTKLSIEIDCDISILNDEEIFKNLNPEVFWNFEIVKELKLFALQNFEIDWDLSLDSLKQMLREKYDLDSEIAEPMFKEYQEICQGLNVPTINPISVKSDVFNSPFDTGNICFTKLMNSIDEAESFMITIARQLNIEKFIYNLTEVTPEPAATLPATGTLNKENSSKLPKGKSDQKTNAEEPLTAPTVKEVLHYSFDNVQREAQKCLFREKAYYAVAHVIRNLLSELDHIFDRMVN